MWMSYRREPAAGMTRVLLTRPRRRMLRALSAFPPGWRLAGSELGVAAGVSPAALYPFLDHLQAAAVAAGLMPGGCAPRRGARIAAAERVRDAMLASWALTDDGRAQATRLLTVRAWW